MMTISIEREGNFPVIWSHSNKHQCGNQGTPIVDYKVRIVGREQDLNPHGWLIDNLDIPNYFINTYSKIRDFLSCELIAQRACKDLISIVEKGGARVSKITVSVSAIKGSWITADCTM